MVAIKKGRAGSVTEWLRTLGRESVDNLTPASSMPHEILLHILRLVTSTNDLRNALVVCKAWCQCGVELLWHKPSFLTTSSLIKMLVTLASRTQTFPYSTFIRRLNFSGLADNMSDHILLRLTGCLRLERLTLSSCTGVSDEAIVKMLARVPDLVALDLSDCKHVTDESLVAVSKGCPKLQGLNLSGCKAVSDVGIVALSKCKALRRLKLKSCELVTDDGLMKVIAACPLLLEVDLVGCKQATNATLWKLWKHSAHLRELSLSGLSELSDAGFPSASNPLLAADGETDPLENQPKLDPLGFPIRMHYDHIRFLDLTSLGRLTDASVEGIVRHMPRIRNLVLAKCTNLTDESLNSICKLGKHLHYLHLGHVSSLTDRAVIRLARACTRLRYIDLACCTNLTDMSVFELALCLPRLKRIGLVRVTNITDHSVNCLVERTSLERIHLSYCDNISVGAIHALLSKLNRLTHLSLTGVPAFRRQDLQTWCRAPPKDFNNHQRQAFCVYSGKGVNELRRYLAALYFAASPNGTGNTWSSDDPQPMGPMFDAAVFNSMPDARTIQAAMAYVRANSSHGGSNSSRRGRFGDRSNHTTPAPQPQAPLGYLQYLPDLRPPSPLSTGPSANTASHGVPNGATGLPDEPISSRVYNPRANGRGEPSRAEVAASVEFFRAAMGQQGPQISAQTLSLQSPLPLYSPADRAHHFNASAAASGSRYRTQDDAALATHGASRLGALTPDGSEGGATVRRASLVRRRSDQEMAVVVGNGGTGVGGGGGGGVRAGGSGDGVGRGLRRGRGLEVPDRMDSTSPMEIEDDERPPVDEDEDDEDMRP